MHKPKPKATKCINFESLLQIEIWPMWREAHFQIKMVTKTILGALLKIRMWKNTRRYDGKYISKS